MDLPQDRVDLKDFELLTVIGRGGFGEVPPSSALHVCTRAHRCGDAQVRVVRKKDDGKV